MIDLTYLALVLCLLATSFTRLCEGFLSLYRFLLGPWNPELVPYFVEFRSVPTYFDRQGLNSIGMIPLTLRGDQLETNWVCEALPGHRGSVRALTWQKGKQIHRQCVGILECHSRSCSADMQIARAARGIDRHRQLQTTCTCGERLQYLQCGVKMSVHLFRSGAYFINSSDQTHARFTHSLIYRPHEDFELREYRSKRLIRLSGFARTQQLSHSTSDEDGPKVAVIGQSVGSEKVAMSRETPERAAEVVEGKKPAKRAKKAQGMPVSASTSMKTRRCVFQSVVEV
ncbi:hypothetical protein DFH09DRAFT_1087996 [Mycena vulgaris]|nr:hypothetical protein DFH09DRAFT_1087996 [Mycena vulgaris]